MLCPEKIKLTKRLRLFPNLEVFSASLSFVFKAQWFMFALITT